MVTILVVDDDFYVLDTIYKLLEFNSYNVLKAVNVAHAMALLELNFVDLIILDLSMPRKDGTYLFSYLEENYPGTKVIVYSGLDIKTHPEKDLILSKSSGFVSKGKDVNILLKKINKVLKC
jgi:DNA-binding NtrC family response regulator